MARRRHHHIVWLVALIAWAVIGTGAVAADQTVNVGTNNGVDKTVAPSAVSIFTGNTVTWEWVGPSGDTDHIIESNPRTQAEDWDSDPGLPTVTHLVGHTFAHTFTQVGTFTYWCRIHELKMAGTVAVADGRPTAAFTMTPQAATAGQRVDFDAMSSSDPDGIVTNWDWDLDDNGTFETPGATANRTYATAGTVTIALRVTDNLANTRTATKQLVISAPPAQPAPVQPMPTSLPLESPIVYAPPLVAKLTASAVAKQRGAATRGVAVQALCDLGCFVTATGQVVLPGGKKITLTKTAKTLTAGQPLKLVLMVPAKSRAALLKHLKTGKMATATIVLTTAQGASVKKTVKLTR